MINLLPYDTKKQIKAARTNFILLQFTILLGFSIVFLTLACGVTYYFIDNIKASASVTSGSTTSPNSTQAKVDTFRNNLSNSRIILDRQVVYGDVIAELDALLPADNEISSFTLTDASFGSIVDVQVRIASSEGEKAFETKMNSINSTLFSDYKLGSTVPENATNEYPKLTNFKIRINKVVNR